MRAWPLALVLVTAACGSPGPVAAPTPSTRTVITTHSAEPLPTIEGNPVHFHTSDGNVGCDLEPAYVLCNVNVHTWRPPPKPSDCFYTWGKAVELSVGSKGAFFCGHGESYLASRRVLAPHQALRVGLVTCRATTNGVTCSAEGGGFFLGRDSYRLF